MPQPCDDCLDSQRCWVCLGQGTLEVALGQRKPCERCSGTGKCSLCTSLRIPDLGGAPGGAQAIRLRSPEPREV